MASKQIQFNPDKVCLLNRATSSYATDENFGLDQKIRYGMDITAKKFNTMTSIPENGGNYNLLQRIGSTIDVAANDLHKKEAKLNKLTKIAMLGSLAVWYAYELGPVNESVFGNVAVYAQNALAQGGASLENAKVGIITGAVTGAGQAIGGLLTSGGVRIVPDAFKFWDKTKKPEKQIEEESYNPNEIALLSDKSPNPFSGPFSLFPSKALKTVKNPHAKKKEKGDLLTAFVLGTGPAIVEQNAKNPERTFKQDAKMALGYATVIATINSALITGISAGVSELEKAGFANLADMVEYVAKNPLTYLEIFVVIKGYKYHQKNKFTVNKDPIPIE